MKANEHPDFQVESDNLDLTLKHIQELLGRGFLAGGATAKANLDLYKIHQENERKWRLALQDPYSVRVDIDEDGKIERYYIGKVALPAVKVYSWAADQPSAWFYQDYPEVRRKRVFVVRQANLEEINDQFIHPNLKDISAASSPSEESLFKFTDPLLNILAKNREGQLADIVATIQQRQYQIIKAPLEQLLVIQGVAGSGKSTIALHRVAYFLYNQRDRLGNVLVLGPNRMFMSYVAGLLPSLGEYKVDQQSVDDWLLDKLGSSIKYDSIDTSLEFLLSMKESRARKEIHYRNSQLKGSLRMAAMLERYVGESEIFQVTIEDNLTCEVSREALEDRAVVIQRTPEQLRKFVERHRTAMFNQRLRKIEKDLIVDLIDEVFRKKGENLKSRGFLSIDDDKPEVRSKVEQEITRQVRAYFKKWNKIKARNAYQNLLGQPELLRQAGQGIFSSVELELL